MIKQKEKAGFNMDINVSIKGIHCAGCLNRIQQSLNTLGVIRFDLDYQTHVAHITYDEHELDVVDILQSIENNGYEATLID